MQFYLGFLEYSRLTVSSDRRRFLDNREENTFNTLKTGMARRSFLAGRILAKSLVSDLIDMPAEAVTISLDDSGNPGVDSEAAVFFSIAHSGGWTACAVSLIPVGLDMEKRSENRNWPAIVDACFHPGEGEIIRNISGPEERSRYFHRLWTVKEAYIKARGLTVWDIGTLPRIRRHQSPKQGSPDAVCFEPAPDLFLGLYSPRGVQEGTIVSLPRFPGPGNGDWSSEGFIIPNTPKRL